MRTLSIGVLLGALLPGCTSVEAEDPWPVDAARVAVIAFSEDDSIRLDPVAASVERELYRRFHVITRSELGPVYDELKQWYSDTSEEPAVAVEIKNVDYLLVLNISDYGSAPRDWVGGMTQRLIHVPTAEVHWLDADPDVRVERTELMPTLCSLAAGLSARIEPRALQRRNGKG